jgi:SAM-dependent methyltransferase
VPLDNIDAIYYRDGVSNWLGMTMLKHARYNMMRLFFDKMRPTAETTIVDIGVSDDENDGANFFEKNYPWPHQITCAGLGPGHAVKQRYPEIAYQQIIAGAPLPFPDKHFDIACSNAVLEHVGGREERRAFILEHLRVARSVFLTVPNRWFPVEHHTGIPILHYSPRLFRWLLNGSSMAYWTDPQNMDFLDPALLMQEWPTKCRPSIFLTGIWLSRFSSNIAICIRSEQA